MSQYLSEHEPQSEPAVGYRRGRRLTTLTLGAALVAILIVTALLAPWLAPFDPNLQHIELRLLPPSAAHWLGTDGFGRDLLSRVIYGARPTLILVSLILVLTIPIGLLVGIGAGYLGGWVERILMRLTDIFLSLPSLVIALAFVAVMGPGLMNGALALALTSWPAFARQARAETWRCAAATTGGGAHAGHQRAAADGRPHFAFMPAERGGARGAESGGIILSAAGLGFLGMGVAPPTAEWGSMVAEGSKVIFDQWWVAAARAILFASLAFNLLGDGLRDKMDPRHGH